MEPGDWVRIERDETRWPSKGTWPRYRGRVGRVAQIHREKLPTKRVYVEIGVTFTAPDTKIEDLRTEAWFLPHELVAVPRPRRHPTDAQRPAAARKPRGRYQDRRQRLSVALAPMA